MRRECPLSRARRFRALALFRRQPSEHVASLAIAGVRKPEQTEKNRHSRSTTGETRTAEVFTDRPAAGATGANKDLFDLLLVDRETVGDRYH